MPRVRSDYTGVYWSDTYRAWQARISLNGKPRSLGLHKTEHLAALAFNEACIALRQEPGPNIICSPWPKPDMSNVKPQVIGSDPRLL
jgi:hypothetical protein